MSRTEVPLVERSEACGGLRKCVRDGWSYAGETWASPHRGWRPLIAGADCRLQRTISQNTEPLEVWCSLFGLVSDLAYAHMASSPV